MVNPHAQEFSSKLPYSNAHKTKQNSKQVLLQLNGKELPQSLWIYQGIIWIFTWQKNKQDTEKLVCISLMKWLEK